MARTIDVQITGTGIDEILTDLAAVEEAADRVRRALDGLQAKQPQQSTWTVMNAPEITWPDPQAGTVELEVAETGLWQVTVRFVPEASTLERGSAPSLYIFDEKPTLDRVSAKDGHEVLVIEGGDRRIEVPTANLMVEVRQLGAHDVEALLRRHY